MELGIVTIVIAILGGFFAGVINTLAGNGSAITLTIFTELLGLPGNVANGTNRIGILAQAVTSNYEFNRKGILKMDLVKPVVIPVLLGSVLGVYLALIVSNEAFKQIFGVLLTVLFFVILVKPKRWLDPEKGINDFPLWITLIIYFALGVYGGFIQMGMGVFFLATMVLISKYRITQANAVKIFVVGLYTVAVLALFAYKGLVDWKLGGIVAIGQATGGWITANLASRFIWMEKVAYYLLIAIIIITLFFFYDIGSKFGF